MQTRPALNHSWFLTQAKLIEQGIKFPFDSINGILLTNVDKEKMAVEKNKDKVFEFIQTKKKAYVSEIAKIFDLDIIETKLILDKLKREHKIIINE